MDLYASNDPSSSNAIGGEGFLGLELDAESLLLAFGVPCGDLLGKNASRGGVMGVLRKWVEVGVEGQVSR